MVNALGSKLLLTAQKEFYKTNKWKDAWENYLAGKGKFQVEGFSVYKAINLKFERWDMDEKSIKKKLLFNHTVRKALVIGN